MPRIHQRPARLAFKGSVDKQNTVSRHILYHGFFGLKKRQLFKIDTACLRGRMIVHFLTYPPESKGYEEKHDAEYSMTPSTMFVSVFMLFMAFSHTKHTIQYLPPNVHMQADCVTVM